MQKQKHPLHDRVLALRAKKIFLRDVALAIGVQPTRLSQFLGLHAAMSPEIESRLHDFLAVIEADFNATANGESALIEGAIAEG